MKRRQIGPALRRDLKRLEDAPRLCGREAYCNAMLAWRPPDLSRYDGWVGPRCPHCDRIEDLLVAWGWIIRGT